MNKTPKLVDVFIAHGLNSLSLAADLARELTAAGLKCFSDVHSASTGSNWVNEVWEALAESRVMIAIWGPETGANLPMFVGAALAWNKPLFIVNSVFDGPPIPALYSGYESFDSNQISALIRAVKKVQTPLTENELENLKVAYKSGGVSVDKLATSPKALRTVAKKFKSLAKREVASEVLLAELMRLRKQRKLPRTDE